MNMNTRTAFTLIAATATATVASLAPDAAADIVYDVDKSSHFIYANTEYGDRDEATFAVPSVGIDEVKSSGFGALQMIPS